MKQGYYLLLPHPKGETYPDLGEKQIVFVGPLGERVELCGSDMAYRIDVVKGSLIGPLDLEELARC